LDCSLKVIERKHAGEESVVWNGKYSRGGQAASGMYFYKLDGENVSLSQKMVLMK